MMPAQGRWLRWAVGILGAALALRLAWGFPWRATAAAIVHANGLLLLCALVINLISLVAKGWGWHLLLRAAAPHRWIAAQEANLLGAAVNSLTIAGVGEGARVHFIVDRERIPLGLAVASVLWARIVEGIGLALSVLLAASFLRLPAAIRGLEVALAATLFAALVAAWLGGRARLSTWLPRRVRAALSPLAQVGSAKRLCIPILFALVNWAAQWTTYHLAIRAMHVPVTFAASFTALLMANAGGVLRLTPANVGVMQASIVIGLVPFGIAPEDAVAASLALQVLQVLPVLAIGAALAARHRTAKALARRAEGGRAPKSPPADTPADEGKAPVLTA